MKLTEQQFMILHQTTAETLRIADGAGLFTYDAKTRRAIVEQILRQQGGEVPVGEEKKS